ncbi:MAG TPA: DNA polymerase III subunit chi [Candidatus Megaira endosymbiont of Nemacystus decipiens]|nr:DNA polymerase III subunit chi [Candidatus Megaera endosymbiont of Nemacystus decipiens]
MAQIKCYSTSQELLMKSFCKLAEKSYGAFKKTLVISDREEMTTALDNALWTYSKKNFIPHAKIVDPMSGEHPILITNCLQSQNLTAQNLILVNLNSKSLLETIKKLSHVENIKKISIIHDENIDLSNKILNDILIKSNITIEEIKFYKQLSVDKWSVVT